MYHLLSNMSIGKVSYDTHALREGGDVVPLVVPRPAIHGSVILSRKRRREGVAYFPLVAPRRLSSPSEIIPDFTLSKQTRGNRTVAAPVSS